MVILTFRCLGGDIKLFVWIGMVRVSVLVSSSEINSFHFNEFHRR